MSIKQKAFFNCFSNKPVEWKFRDGAIPHNARVVPSKKRSLKHSLVISEVLLDNEGMYQCVGLDNEQYFESEGTLTVKGKFYL